MKNIYPLFFVVILAACGSTTSPADLAAKASPQITRSVVSRAVASTDTPTIAPTSGAEATQIAARATSDASNILVARANAQGAYLRATQTEANALRTEAAYVLALTADNEDRVAGATSQSVRATQDITQATRTQDARVFAGRVPTIEAAMTQVQYVAAREQAGIVVSWMIIFVAFSIGCVGLAFAWRYITRPQPIDYNYLAPVPVTPLERAIIARPDGSLDLDTQPPGSPAKFSAFSSYALTGAPLGINKIEATKIYTRAEYAPVFRWMKKKAYLGPNDGGTGLSRNGEMFCALWIGNNPPSSAQENIEKQADNSHEHDSHGHVTGGGVI